MDGGREYVKYYIETFSTKCCIIYDHNSHDLKKALGKLKNKKLKIRPKRLQNMRT